MKLKETLDKAFVRRSALTGLLFIIVAAVTLEATALIQYYFSRKGIREEAALRAESQLEANKLKIMGVIDQAETSVRNSIWLAQWALDVPDSLIAVSRRIVQENPVIVGSTIALIPGYDKKHSLFSPYCFQAPGQKAITFSSLATPEYNYPEQEWFTKPLELDAGYWSEPYIDVGGGNILMTTYSVPLHDRYGRQAGVLTADISLDWLTDLVGSVQVYPNAFSMVISRTGQIMVCPAESLVMHRTVQEVISDMEDTSAFSSLNRSMLSGDRGNVRIRYDKNLTHVFYAPVERTGWSMSIMIPDEEIFGNIRKVGMIVKILQILGILMLILLLRAVARDQVKYIKLNERKEKMQNELKIASDIQMSMVPKIFPPFPERKDLDMSAAIVPAKEVGGDLYDFFIRDEKLFFCIGDVSGKGVPASLVMAVTRSLFRTVATHERSPQRIVTTMNESMSELNESNMFVTFFCGILDLANGHLRYCNAGHNAPVMLTDAKRKLPVEPNLPLGVLPGMYFKEQETDMNYDDAIFLYTDGLTEAENSGHELFGEDRMNAVLSTRRDSESHLKAMQEAVAAFVGDALQSDDLTMLFIHYVYHPDPDRIDKHLQISNEVSRISELEGFVNEIAEDKHLDSALAMNLNLALEEAVTNVVMYAYPEGTEGTVDISASEFSDRIEFRISDKGKPFDPTAAPDADITLGVEERGIGGLGIFMVRKIMDEVSYERIGEKNILTMIKRI